ncbi:hypothetical protein ACIBJC_33640 [Streptomyces sp. NPDC050509]|uniref:hypothetical protein n=1 Tax=Streptomyces sp. NPDC050509 TaxID=3365620 RepID=UPI0037A69984
MSKTRSNAAAVALIAVLGLGLGVYGALNVPESETYTAAAAVTNGCIIISTPTGTAATA